MRRALTAPVAVLPLPAGTEVAEFDASVAPECRTLMNEVYAVSEGEAPTDFAAWWPRLIADSEFDPRLVFVVRAEGRLVGYCHGWTVPFVKDLVVAADQRGRGLGGALLTRLLAEYRARGATSVDLKTAATNFTAQRLYRQLGFEIVTEA